MPLELRPYQNMMVEKIMEGFEEHQSIMCQMPTGTGKTEVFCAVIQKFLEKFPNKKILVLVHREELLRQIIARLRTRVGINAGIIDANGMIDFHRNVIVGMVVSVERRGLEFPASLLVIDEAHHSNANTYLKLIEPFLENEKTKLLGVTATPGRLDRKKLSDIYEILLVSPSIRWYISKGYLAKLRYYGTKQMDLGKLKIAKLNGDYELEAASEMMRSPKLLAEIVSSYFKFAEGKKTLIFCVDIAHAIDVMSRFEDLGIDIDMIDSKTQYHDRIRIVERFKSGRLKILINVLIFTEGFDCPDIEVVMLARPTQSITLYLQMVGRVTRNVEGKECGIILDNAGNYKIHGLPTNRFDWHGLFSNPEGLTNEEFTRRVRSEADVKARNPPMESEMIEMYELIDGASKDTYDVEDAEVRSFIDLPLKNVFPETGENIHRADNRESYYLKNHVCPHCKCEVHRFEYSRSYRLFDQMLPEIKVHECGNMNNRTKKINIDKTAFPVEVNTKINANDSIYLHYFTRLNGNGRRLRIMIYDLDMKDFLDNRNPVIVRRKTKNELVATCYSFTENKIETISRRVDKAILDDFFTPNDPNEVNVDTLELLDVESEYDAVENELNMADAIKADIKKSNSDDSSLHSRETEIDTNEFFIVGKQVMKGGVRGVQLAEQIWMVENLSVIEFRNGDLIDIATNPTEWSLLGRARKPACCFYENKIENGDDYGMLYNWYAVNDARGLAPVGWHIPTSLEWERLFETLGQGDLANNRLKGSKGWASFQNNKNLHPSGFSALPGGYRDQNGVFRFFGLFGNWWSASELGNSSSRFYGVYETGDSSNRIQHQFKGCGLSVRCIKD